MLLIGTTLSSAGGVESFILYLSDDLLKWSIIPTPTVARLVFRLRRSDHITDALVSLHRLRMPQRIIFKIAVQTYRAIHGDAPQYLRQLHRSPTSRFDKDCVIIIIIIIIIIFFNIKLTNATMCTIIKQMEVFFIRPSTRSCCQTAYCCTSRLPCRRRSHMERFTGQRHLSTISAHLQKTTKLHLFRLSYPDL